MAGGEGARPGQYDRHRLRRDGRIPRRKLRRRAAGDAADQRAGGARTAGGQHPASVLHALRGRARRPVKSARHPRPLQGGAPHEQLPCALPARPERLHLALPGGTTHDVAGVSGGERIWRARHLSVYRLHQPGLALPLHVDHGGVGR